MHVCSMTRRRWKIFKSESVLLHHKDHASPRRNADQSLRGRMPIFTLYLGHWVSGGVLHKVEFGNDVKEL